MVFASLSCYGQIEDEDNISHVSIGATHSLLNNKIFGLENTSIAQMNISYGHDWNGLNYRFPFNLSFIFSSNIADSPEETDAYSSQIDSGFSFSFMGNVGKRKHFLGGHLGIDVGGDFFGVNNELYRWYRRGYFATFLGPSYQYETQISSLPLSINVNFPVLASVNNWGFFQYTVSDEPTNYVQGSSITSLNKFISPNLSLKLDIFPKKVNRWAIIYNAQYTALKYDSGFPWIHTFQQTVGIRLYYQPDWDNNYTW